MNITEVILAGGGAARWRELRAHVRQRDIDEAVASGRIVRRRLGVYSLSEPSARGAAAELGGVLCHLSAAYAHNMGVLVSPDEFHVAVPPTRSRRPAPPGVRMHYVELGPEDIARGLTTRRRTVIDCLRACSFPQALAIADTCLRNQIFSVEELETLAAQMRGPGAKRGRRVVAAADPRAASEMESALRGILVDAGITCFEPQFAAIADGRVLATTDLGDEETKVLIEADSFAWHGNRQALARDARRYDLLVANGYLVLRFAWEHIINEAAWVVATVGKTLEHARPT